MLDWTDRHCRYFHRLLSNHTRLYTEMVTTGALRHGDLRRHLRFHDEEHPVALQLGGSEPQELAFAARLGQEWGYDEINTASASTGSKATALCAISSARSAKRAAGSSSCMRATPGCRA